MLKAKLFTLYIFFKNLICPCFWDQKANDFNVRGRDRFRIVKTGKLPEVLNESSGTLALNIDSLLFYTFNDGGGDPNLYLIDCKGNLLDSVIIPGAKNKDWEDITADKKGNIYIGDFGNNLNVRKDLKIYKFNPFANITTTISFNYPDQESFPPSEENMNFDCEAFFWYENNLYLFSKNRGKRCVKIYKVPDSEGKHVAELIDETYLSSMVTGAAVSPSDSAFALLAYGKIYRFSINKNGVNFKTPHSCLRFSRSGQAEGIDYFDDQNLILTNEARKIFLVRRR